MSCVKIKIGSLEIEFGIEASCCSTYVPMQNLPRGTSAMSRTQFSLFESWLGQQCLRWGTNARGLFSLLPPQTPLILV